MPVSATTRATFELLIRTWISPVLSDSGFKRSGRTWKRETADPKLLSMIGVNARRYPDDDAIKFTVEWAVHVQGYAATAIGLARPPSIASAPFYLRIGWLLDHPEDVWWDVTRTEVVRRAAGKTQMVQTDDVELRSVLASRLLPLATRDWSLPALIRFLASDVGRPYLKMNKPLDRSTSVLDMLNKLRTEVGR